MDTSYSAHVSKEDNRPPVFRRITLSNVLVEGSGKVTLEGLDEEHRLELTLQNVIFDDPAHIKVSAKHADVKAGPEPLPFRIAGDDVTIAPTAGRAVRNACESRFVPFPMK